MPRKRVTRAESKTRTRAELMRVEDGLWVVEASDDRGHSYRFMGKSLVNAAGPAVLDVLGRAYFIEARWSFGKGK